LGKRLIKIFLTCLFAVWIAFFFVDVKVDGWKKVADRFLAAGQAETAEEMYQKIKRIQPWRTLDWRTLALMYTRQGKPEKVISILEPWIKNDRLDVADVVMLSTAYEITGDTEKSRELLETASRKVIDGNDYQIIQLQRAKLHRAKHEYDQALACLRQLQEKGLNTPESEIDTILLTVIVSPERLSMMDIEDSSLPDWVKEWSRSISDVVDESDPSQRWFLIGRRFGSIGEWDLAEYAFMNAVDLSPEMADSWALLAEARQQQGKSGKDAITRALELAPDSPAVRLTAALYYRRQQDTKKAIELLEENIRDNPNEVIWYLEKGNALAEGGRLDDAVMAYQRAVDLYPEDPAGYRAAARFSIQYAYRLEEVGLEAANSVIALDRDAPDGYDLKGLILSALGKPEEASAAYQIAIEKDEKYAPVWLHIGQMALEQADFSSARDALEKSIKLGGRSYEAQLAGRLLKEYFGEVIPLP